jgi:hypothetical protein
LQDGGGGGGLDEMHGEHDDGGEKSLEIEMMEV